MIISKLLPFSNRNFITIMLYQEWVSETFGATEFKITDVPKDGACGYRVLSMVLETHCPNNPIVLNEEDLPRVIQIKLSQFIYDNWSSSVIDEIGYPTLGEAVLDTHEVSSKEEYIEIFGSHFAGDPDKIKVGEEETVIKSGVRKGMTVKKPIYEEIAVRWAGIPELYAFYKLFKIGLTIVHPERWIERKTKSSGPVKAAVSNLNSRFRCSLWFPPIQEGIEATIMWDNKVSSPHFMYLERI